MKYSATIEATQWFKNGDHPKDNVWRPFEDTGKLPTEPREGGVVRYYRYPNLNGTDKCDKCGEIMHYHGFIDNMNWTTFDVCPGDYVITYGNYYVCINKYKFEKLYALI